MWGEGEEEEGEEEEKKEKRDEKGTSMYLVAGSSLRNT